MHELALMQSVISIVEREAARCGARRVESIRLRVGELSGIVPGCLEEFFPIAAAGTRSERARLEIEPLGARIECPDCGYEGAPQGAECPRCGGSAFRLVAGREFFVESMEVE